MTQSAAPPASGRRVPWFQIFSYVAPSLPLAAVGMPLVVHLPQFYASHEVGIPLAMTGFVFMMLRMIDVFFDPAAGFISDRWRTRWGPPQADDGAGHAAARHRPVVRLRARRPGPRHGISASGCS